MSRRRRKKSHRRREAHWSVHNRSQSMAVIQADDSGINSNSESMTVVPADNSKINSNEEDITAMWSSLRVFCAMFFSKFQGLFQSPIMMWFLTNFILWLPVRTQVPETNCSTEWGAFNYPTYYFRNSTGNTYMLQSCPREMDWSDEKAYQVLSTLLEKFCNATMNVPVPPSERWQLIKDFYRVALLVNATVGNDTFTSCCLTQIEAGLTKLYDESSSNIVIPILGSMMFLGLFCMCDLYCCHGTIGNIVSDLYYRMRNSVSNWCDRFTESSASSSESAFWSATPRAVVVSNSSSDTHSRFVSSSEETKPLLGSSPGASGFRRLSISSAVSTSSGVPLSSVSVRAPS